MRGAVWLATAVVLLQQAAPPSFPQIARDVNDPSVKVRRAALRSLAERGDPEALPLLARLVNDVEPDLAEKAIETVIGIYVQPPAGRSMHDAADAFALAALHAFPWPVPAELSVGLARALAHDSPSVRRDSAYALGIVQPLPASERIGFELIASLGDREPSVRLAAARTLGALQVRSAIVPLVAGVNDDDLDVRLASMRALGDLRAEQAVQALTEQFRFYVRGAAGRAALDALARIASPASRALFEAQTDSGYPAHRQSAYEGLARLGGLGAAAPRIEAALSKEKDERVAMAMAFALAADNRSGIARILDALADKDLRDAATIYLVELGKTHTPAIAARLTDPDARVREQIAIALGLIGGAQAQTALSAAVADGSPEVRRAVEVALLRVRQQSE